MAESSNLPPLPPSDNVALERNKYDSFYRIGARKFWGPNRVEKIVVKSQTKCQHEFEGAQHGVRCKLCNFGLFGTFQIKNGKLFHNGEQIPL